MIGRDTEVDAGDASLRLWAAAASDGLFRPLDALKRLCHRDTLHSCVLSELAEELDPAALAADPLAA
jgi:hypothetical protein